MTITNLNASQVLLPAKLRQIVRSEGPCLTIFLPSRHPGESTGTPAAFLKASIKEAALQLAKSFSIPAIGSLLEPIRDLAKDPSLASGSRGSRVILRSRTVFEYFDLSHPVTASATLGSVFSIRKLLESIIHDAPHYILAVTKTKVSLFRCAYNRLEHIDLPAGIPATLAEAMAFDRPDHDLENRSAADTNLGSMHRVRFGTGSGRETEHTHLADYYKLIDRGLTEFFGETNSPLILSGVGEEMARYKAVAHYSQLLQEGIPGSHNLADPSTVLKQAYSILHNRHLQMAAGELAEAKERVAAELFLTDLQAILGAAFEGRVDRLYLAEGAQTVDMYQNGAFRTLGREDLLNAAAVQTMAHGGSTCELPAGLMLEKCTAIAFLRY